MALTPNIMMAVEGLLANPGTALQRVPLTASAGLTTYLAQAIVADYQSTIATYEAAEAAGNIPQTTVDAFITALDILAPYISYAGTTDAGVPVADFEAIRAQHAENLFPLLKAASRVATNNQEFVQYALIAMGARDTSNKYVNSAVNGAALTAQTFTTQDALITGNLAAVSTDANACGEELYASGVLFNFARLDHLGTPQAIIEALMKANMLGSISDELTVQGLDAATLAKSISENPDLTLTPIVQKRCYDALQLVTGEKLTDILEAMQFVTGGITTLSDLLDLRKVFPTTFDTITAPDSSGSLQNIYTSAGNLTSHFSGVTAPLTAVIPDELAIANYVFTCSLAQVTGIRNATPTGIGAAACGIENNDGLPNTGGLTEALPSTTSASIIASMGGGSGPNTSFYLTDFLGSAANLSNNTGFDTLNTILPAVQTAGGYNDLAELLLIMRDVLGGTDTPRVKFTFTAGANPPPDDYQIEILPGYPAAGFYNSSVDYPYSSALSALITEMVNVTVPAYIAAYPTQHNEMMDAYANLYSSVVEGIKQLWDSNVRFNKTLVPGYQTSDLVNEPSASFNNVDVDGIPAQKSSTLAFAENLGQYGKLTGLGDIAEILEAMAQSTLSGNAIIAAMREGRNKVKLSSAGIKSDNEISNNPQ